MHFKLLCDYIYLQKLANSWQKMGTTFKAVVYADNKKKDGTYNVKIRVTHNRRSLKVSTNIYVFPDDLGRKLQIKNQEVIDLADDLIPSLALFSQSSGHRSRGDGC